MLRILLVCTILLGALAFSSTAQAASTYRPPGNIGLGDGYVKTQIGYLSVTCQYRAGYFLGFFFRSQGYTYCTGYANPVWFSMSCVPTAPPPSTSMKCTYAVSKLGGRIYGNYNMDNRTFHPR